MITFLEYFGAKLSTAQRKMSPIHMPFNTDGELRSGEGLDKSIADSRKHDASLHPKVERLRLGAATIELLTPVDVQKICQMYKITDLDKGHPKKLSNMPITIMFEPTKQCFILKRDE